jgi:hypothetical protein
MRIYSLNSPFFGIGVCLSLLFFLFALGLQQAPAAAERQLQAVTGGKAPTCGSEIILVGGQHGMHLLTDRVDVQRPKLPPPAEFTLPIYPGCEGEADYEERVFCGFRRLATFIKENQRQPKGSTRERVIFSFEINKGSGLMENVQLQKGTDGRNVTEAQRVLGLLVDRGVRWTPATSDGEPFTIEIGLPFSFHGAGCGE